MIKKLEDLKWDLSTIIASNHNYLEFLDLDMKELKSQGFNRLISVNNQYGYPKFVEALTPEEPDPDYDIPRLAVWDL